MTWEINPADGLPRDVKADPNCPVCNGYGVIDSGTDYGCVLVPCPRCCKEEEKP